MTRFKELKRIELAIEQHNKKEIQWALDYCQSRLQFTQIKSQAKHWIQLIDKLKDELNRSEN